MTGEYRMLIDADLLRGSAELDVADRAVLENYNEHG